MSGKTSRVLVFAVAMLAIAVAPLRAQVVATDAYSLSYFSAFGERGFLNIINTGQIGSPIDASTNQGTVCASIYVFDSAQEMLSCCSCPVTANGLLTFEAASRLVDPTLTGVHPLEGVIKVVADLPSAGVCNPAAIVSPVNGGLRAFLVHEQSPAGPVVTETSLQPTPLTNTEAAFLGNACSFVLYLGSGRGQCFCAVATG